MNKTSTCFFVVLLFSVLIFTSCSDQTESSSQVTIGAQILIDQHLDELEDKRIGLVMNPTARIGDVHMLDTLLALNVNVTALFAPEHGFRGEAGAGDKIEDGIDQGSGLPIFSLYGTNRKPTSEMLESVDLLIFDMQDVGVRFYTYIATLGLVLEAAAESDVSVWVLDRPNPLGGNYVTGWMLEEEFKSFVGPYPIPVAHGLTMGEIAKMIVGEEWMNFENETDLRVIDMEGWNRDMKWPETGLAWVAPSPNLPTFEHAFLYSGTVFFEGTNLSEGRGTDDPFLTLGSSNTELTESDMNTLSGLEGIRVEAVEFTPRSIPGVAPNPKLLGVESNGIKVSVESYAIDPVRTGLKIFQVVMQSTPDAETNSFLYRLAGSREIDGVVSGRADPMSLAFGIEGYLDRRGQYLLYD